jgi:hypothetical protein
MRVQLTPWYELTDEHAASVGGQPVLVYIPNARVFRASDEARFDFSKLQSASQFVKRMGRMGGYTQEQRDLMAKFV